eukprot:SAG31_NODE_4558_length_3138_cov_6.664034_2_plen_57_part_00
MYTEQLYRAVGRLRVPDKLNKFITTKFSTFLKVHGVRWVLKFTKFINSTIKHIFKS